MKLDEETLDEGVRGEGEFAEGEKEDNEGEVDEGGEDVDMGREEMDEGGEEEDEGRVDEEVSVSASVEVQFAGGSSVPVVAVPLAVGGMVCKPPL